MTAVRRDQLRQALEALRPTVEAFAANMAAHVERTADLFKVLASDPDIDAKHLADIQLACLSLERCAGWTATARFRALERELAALEATTANSPSDAKVN